MIRQLVLQMANQDTGGQSHRIKEALGLYSNKYYARNFALKTNYINYPTDIVYKRHDQKEVNNLLRDAYILHIHNKHEFYRIWGRTPKLIPNIIHQHGRICTPSQIKNLQNIDKTNRSLRVISTLNLLKWVNNDPLYWLPSPINLDLYDKLAKRSQNKENKKIRICHCPTNRKLKHTELFIETVNKLGVRHPEVELVLVEGKSHDYVIRTKLTCDIGYDQLLLWYGNNAIKFWALGIPCVVGMPDAIRDESKKLFGYEPWIYANEQSLYQALEELVSDISYRKSMGIIGKEHVRRYHSYQAVATKLGNIYDMAKNLFVELS